MRRFQSIALPVLLWLTFAGLLAAAHQPAAARDVTIGVVRDGPIAVNDIVPVIESELGRLVDPSISVSIKDVPEFNAQWDASRVRQVISNALNDPEVDYLLVLGLLGAQEVASDDFTLTKPVILGSAQFTGIFDTAFERYGPQEKPNLNATLIPHGVARDFERFGELVPFESAAIVMDPVYAEHLDVIQMGLEVIEDSLGINLSVMSVADDPAEALERFGEDIDAVIMGEVPRLGFDARMVLFERLTSMGVPVGSLEGPADVERGALVSFLPETNPIVARRVALNISQLMRGAPVSDLPTILPIDPAILLNGRTAAAIGYAPTFESRIWIDIINEDALDRPETPLTFTQALTEAQAGNVELTIKDADVQTILQEKQIARSPLLPQLGAAADYATNEQGFLSDILPDQIGTVGVGLSQMLYDDRVVSDYRSAKRFYEGAEYDREATRLDVLADAGVAYLAWVLARVNYRINVANLELTQDNLELSKIRYEAGYSGQDEVFRWEAEVARRRSELFRRNAEVEARRIAFNQILGIEQDQRWKPQEVDVDPEVFFFLGGRLDPVFKNAHELSKFRDFMVALALENSPELLTISKAIEAEGIQLGQRKRAFILPTFSAMLNYNYVYHKRPDVPEDLSRSIYEIRFVASYPIFNGAARLYDKRRSETIVQGLNYEQELIRQLVEQQTRTTLRAVENSFPTIKFSQMGADNSNKNLIIVQDKYAEGIVNVTDLLQAQNSAFAADQEAAAAVYSFLIDLVAFERAISWFEDEKSAEEKDALVERIRLEVTSP